MSGNNLRKVADRLRKEQVLDSDGSDLEDVPTRCASESLKI